MALIDCSECGKQISDRAAACPSCGVPVVIQPTKTMVVTAPKSRSLAVLLAMVGGGIGLQKFYLNKPGQGVICILFCWTFIPVIIGFYDGLKYLFTSDQVFQEYCNAGSSKEALNTDQFKIKNKGLQIVAEWFGWYLLIGTVGEMFLIAAPKHAAPEIMNVFFFAMVAAVVLTYCRRLYKKKKGNV
jgi:TM2 domain-containing membrane protein YozV